MGNRGMAGSRRHGLRRAELSAARDRLDADQREATHAVEVAAGKLADLERLSYTPSPPTAAQHKRAEDELSKARARAAEPWAERRRGASAAVADLDAQVQALVRERFDDLAEGLHAQGAQAAQAVETQRARRRVTSRRRTPRRSRVRRTPCLSREAKPRRSCVTIHGSRDMASCPRRMRR
jgi:hypothetical protein